jgi:hypothetical protein
MTLVALRHTSGVTLRSEWLTWPRGSEGTELRQGLMPCGSACVSGYERLIDFEGIFTVSVGVGSLARVKVRMCVVALSRLLFSGLGSYFGLVKPGEQ